MQSTLLTWGHSTRAMLCTVLFTVTFFSACQKESTTTNPSDTLISESTSSENATTTITASQTAMLNVFKIFAQQAGQEGSLTTTPLMNVETRASQCTRITSTGWQRNVNAISIDFGNSCTDIDGRTISGKLNGRLQRSARTGEITEIVLSPSNFMVDCAITTGDMILTNIRLNARRQFIFDWEVRNVYLATLDKKTKKVVGSCNIQSRGRGMQSINGNQRNGRNERNEQDRRVEGRGASDDGQNTSFADAIFDFDRDEYLFEVVSGKIEDSKNGTFGVTTQLGHPIQIDINCAWPNQGIVEITPKAAWILPNFSVDLGNGACDATALVKVGGLLKHTIKMP
jgi:hypothetical protein